MHVTVRPLGSCLLALATLVLWPHERAGAAVIDCWAEDVGPQVSTENYIGVRYKATLIEDATTNTGFMLLFCGTAFTSTGDYQPHFFDMMIKSGKDMAAIYKDELCPTVINQARSEFGFEFGVSDYEDPKLTDNDIGMWSHDPLLFPRTFANVDTANPDAADKAEAEYQVNVGGPLQGKEIQVSLERGREERLPRAKNFFMDPDDNGTPRSHADILYRHWVATFSVVENKARGVVDVYVNASQAAYLRGNAILNVLWENPGQMQLRKDRFKVVMYDVEVKTTEGKWRPIRRFLVDYHSPKKDLPLDEQGRMLGGFRRVDFKGRPALEASFGYGYSDYVVDKDPTQYEKSSSTMGVITLIPSKPSRQPAKNTGRHARTK